MVGRNDIRRERPLADAGLFSKGELAIAGAIVAGKRANCFTPTGLAAVGALSVSKPISPAELRRAFQSGLGGQAGENIRKAARSGVVALRR